MKNLYLKQLFYPAKTRLNYLQVLAILLPAFSLALPVAAQTVVTLGTATTSASTNAFLSTSTTGNLYSKTVTVYAASDILAGGGYAGNITTIRWNKQGAGEYPFGNATFKIWYKHLPPAQLMSVTQDWLTEVAPATLVYSRIDQSLPTGTGYKDWVLDSPVVWNGTDNLVLLVEWYRPNAPTGAINWQYTDMGVTVNSTRVGSTEINTHALLRNDNRPNIQLVFAPLASFDDVGVSAITAPVSGCNLGAAEPITVVVENFGTSAQQNIPVSYTINNSTPVSEIISASIAPNATLSYTFNTTADLSATGPYAIAAYTELATDVIASNNQTTQTIHHFATPQAPTVLNDTICSGQPANLTASGGATGQTYLWYDLPAGGTVLNTNPVFNIAGLTSDSTFFVELSTGACASVRVPVSVVINTPSPVIAQASMVAVCIGDTVNLSAISAGTVSFSWAAAPSGGLFAATGPSVDATPTANTMYYVSATNQYGCITTDSVEVLIAAPPVISIAGNSTICAGSGASLTATGGLTYSWSTGQTGSIISVGPATATTYYVQGSVGNCQAIDSVLVGVETPAVLTVTASPDTVCAGNMVSLMAGASIPGYTFDWLAPVPGGLVSTSGDSVTAFPLLAVTYFVTASNGVCTITDSVTVNLHAPPVVNINQVTVPGVGVQLQAQVSGPGPHSYIWSPAQFLDDPTSASPIAIVPATTTFTVMVTNGNGCIAFQTTNVVFTSAAGNVTTAEIKIAPNPFGNFFTATLHSSEDLRAESALIDVSGRTVYASEVQLHQGDNLVEINVPQTLPAGMYIFRISANNLKYYSRLIKE